MGAIERGQNRRFGSNLCMTRFAERLGLIILAAQMQIQYKARIVKIKISTSFVGELNIYFEGTRGVSVVV